MSWRLIDQIKSSQQQIQRIQRLKDEYDEVLELLIDIVNEKDSTERIWCIERAKQYLEQLKNKR